MTFVSAPYAPVSNGGFSGGSIAIGYNYTQIGGPATYITIPNLSSPSISQTLSNLLGFLQNPGQDGFQNYVGNTFYATILGGLKINTNPIITGSTTTAGNVVGSGGTNLTFAMVNNPSNGDTATFTIQGQPIQVQFVSVIGATPGNVLIGVSAAATL